MFFSRHNCVSALLRDLQLPRLELRRRYNRAVLMYMIVNGLVNIPIHSSLLIPVSVNTRGHFHRFCQLSTRILCFYHSFFPAAIKIWNSLPSSVINYIILPLLNILDLCCTHMCIPVIVNYRCVIHFCGLHLILINK